MVGPELHRSPEIGKQHVAAHQNDPTLLRPAVMTYKRSGMVIVIERWICAAGLSWQQLEVKD
jgi:hypothetical protein